MKRVIIADDSAAARMFISRCLQIAGLNDTEYVEAGNGLEVLEALKKTPTDLIVTDLNMPEMNGVELLKRLKSSPRLNQIPVLVISSAANPEKVRQLEEMGAYAVLSKPISPATVRPVLNPLLDQQEG